MPDGAPLSPDAVARRSFSSAFRGFETNEVRAFLQAVAVELAELHQRAGSLEAALAGAERRAAQVVHLDEATVAQYLGEEAARVLTTARAAATEIRTKAEDSLARMLRDGQDETARLREAAELDAARRLEAAEADAARVRAQAEAVLADAAVAAAAELEAARERGREMLAEAQHVRERVLADLARRRQVGRGQIEQLKAGRDRLLEAYEVVRRTLAEVTEELRVAVPAARAAAEAAAEEAAQRVDVEDVSWMVTGEVPVITMEPAAPQPVPVPAAVGIGLTDPDEAFEGVRILGASPLPAPPVPPVPVAPVVAPAPPVLPEPVPVPEPVAVAEPVAKPEPVALVEPEPEAAPAPEPVVARAPEPVADAVPEPGADVVTVSVAGGDIAPKRPANGAVDELFARIRASRADAVARAHEVLSDPPAPARGGLEVVLDAAAEAEPDGAGAVVDMADVPAVPGDAVAASDGAGTPGDELFAQRDEALGPVVANLSRRLKRRLADEQNGVLDALRRRAKSSTATDLVGAATAHDEAWQAAVEDALWEAARAGARAGGADDETADVVLDAAGVRTVLLDAVAASVAEPLREELSACIGASYGDPDELVEHLRASYREWKTQRLDQVAEELALVGHGHGMHAATPKGTAQRWLVPAGVRCPDADDNALAGPVPCGEPFPTGACLAPAHPGCRCLVAPTR